MDGIKWTVSNGRYRMEESNGCNGRKEGRSNGSKSRKEVGKEGSKQGRTKGESERSGDVGRIIRMAEVTEITNGNGGNEKRIDWVRTWFGEYNNQTDRIK